LNKFNEADLQWFSPDFYKVVPREKLIEGLKLNTQFWDKCNVSASAN